jgi:hypothetical protein
MNQGVERLEAYDYLNALKIFQKLSSSYPGWEAAQVNRGIAALNLQSKEYLEEAEQSFGKALGINPQCLPALVSRGMLYQHQSRIDEMLRDYELAAKIDPEDPHILYQRGTALLEKGRVDDAQMDLEKVVRLQPSFASAYWKLRELFVRRGEREKMMGAIDSFQRLEAADANQGVKMGLKYGEGGKYNFAIRGTAPPGWKGSAAAPKPTAPVFGPRVRITQQGAIASQRPDGRPSAPRVRGGGPRRGRRPRSRSLRREGRLRKLGGRVQPRWGVGVEVARSTAAAGRSCLRAGRRRRRPRSRPRRCGRRLAALPRERRRRQADREGLESGGERFRGVPREAPRDRRR